MATHRGSYVPEIDPTEHRLMIHGMVDRPLIFTMDELKRFPSVTRIHFHRVPGKPRVGRSTRPCRKRTG